MLNRTLLLCMLISACCPTIVGSPGDQSSKNWVPSQEKFPHNTLIDCGGKETESLNIRISNTTLKNCTINGDIRVWGLYRNANDLKLIKKSRTKNYVSELRNSSPTNILIENVKIIGNKTIPLYIGPGVTNVTVKNVIIEGRSDSTMVYIGAESHKVTIEDSLIDASLAKREAIAIDSSDSNILRNNTIKGGGVYLYRNCGENGVIRHTTPSYNVIANNTFLGAETAVWLGSREGNRCYCALDAGWPFGSSQSDMDHARFNEVVNNKLNGGQVKFGKYSRDNAVLDNEL